MKYPIDLQQIIQTELNSNIIKTGNQLYRIWNCNMRKDRYNEKTCLTTPMPKIICNLVKWDIHYHCLYILIIGF